MYMYSNRRPMFNWMTRFIWPFFLIFWFWRAHLIAVHIHSYFRMLYGPRPERIKISLDAVLPPFIDIHEFSLKKDICIQMTFRNFEEVCKCGPLLSIKRLENLIMNEHWTFQVIIYYIYRALGDQRFHFPFARVVFGQCKFPIIPNIISI